MIVCAYIIMSWFILLSLVTIITEFKKFEAKGLNVFHSIIIIVISVLGIIGVACK